jgi:hypothetical protein
MFMQNLPAVSSFSWLCKQHIFNDHLLWLFWQFHWLRDEKHRPSIQTSIIDTPCHDGE